MSEAGVPLLEALERQFERLEQAGRDTSPPRRLPRLLPRSIAVAVLLALTLGAVAAAVSGFSTGIASVDRLLEHMPGSSLGGDHGAPDGSARESGPRPRLSDLRAGPGQASRPLKVSFRGRRLVAAAYVNRAGEVCKAVTLADPNDPDDARGTAGGCARIEFLARKLARETLDCCGYFPGGNRLLLTGFAHSGITALRVLGSDGPVEAQLTPAWRPQPGGPALRFFVAQAAWRESPSLPRMEAEYSDGRIVDVRP